MNSKTFYSAASVWGIVGLSALVGGEAIANENSQSVLDQIKQYSEEPSLAQVNSVFQLSDVSPSDWAFDALRNLVENYNCIVGYPDGTFRGTRPLSRYEFAAGLNACLQQLERLISSGSGEVTVEDLAALRRLLNEFEAELATLGARVDDLEGRTDFLENHQFSTTTKLRGEVIFSLASAFGDRKANGEDLDNQLTFSNRVRLDLNTSFREDGRDLLFTRLESGNVPNLNDPNGSDPGIPGGTGTNAARLAYEFDNNNDVQITDVWYRFPIGNNTRAYFGAVGLGIDDVFRPNNPFFSSGGNGSLSRFARYNPTIYRATSGSGAGISHDFSDKLTLAALYVADTGDAANPASKNGLFNGSYSAGAQLSFAPTSNLSLALSYLNSYQNNDAGNNNVNTSGGTGSSLATRPFGNVATSSNNFGLEASWRVAQRVNLAGWVGYTDAERKDGTTGSAEIWNWSANLAFLDIGGQGNVLGLSFGQLPKVTSGNNDLTQLSERSSSYLAELQYRYKVNNNIIVTPGVYAVFNPNNNDQNETIIVGAVRTTFSF
ncbi:S-layer protein [Synechococcus moorigangaii CMS01]|nr:S-layer protein [Synechococcus moorigangaii CMS01]